MEDNYRKFVQGYIALCEETGYYFDVTKDLTVGIFNLEKEDNQDVFATQIENLKGE